jgi:uncharacterized 2Fe-2S/4Fe-4S cluster protein (DUF4445 family)
MEIVLSTGKKLDIEGRESLLQALKRQSVYLVASCGGKGICGKCRVGIFEGSYRTESKGKLEPRDTEKGMVIACQTFPESDIVIDIPKESRLVVGDIIEISKSKDLSELFRSLDGKITPLVKWISLDILPPTIDNNIADLERLRKAVEENGLKGMRFSHGFVSSLARSLRDAGWRVNLAYADSLEALFLSLPDRKERYGIAVDVGTTTLVVYLVNLTDGNLVDVGSTYNSQIRYGDDVITRIIFAEEGGGLKELKDAVVTDINDLLAPIIERHAIQVEDIESAVISGNTTMSHLFWGLNPVYIREEPYTPTLNAFPLWKAHTAQINVNEQAPVYTVPCVASYIGGDIVAGVLASKMHRKSETAIFMDIGTNGDRYRTKNG